MSGAVVVALRFRSQLNEIAFSHRGMKESQAFCGGAPRVFSADTEVTIRDSMKTTRKGAGRGKRYLVTAEVDGALWWGWMDAANLVSVRINRAALLSRAA